MTDAQKAKCLEIAAAFDRGESGPYERAEPTITGEMRVFIHDHRKNWQIWQARADRLCAAKIAAKKAAEAIVVKPSRQYATVTHTPRTARIETEFRSHDLDFWADDVEPDDDDDDDPMPICQACKGSGVGKDGNRCTICGGRGRIPAEDQPDQDDDESEDE